MRGTWSSPARARRGRGTMLVSVFTVAFLVVGIAWAAWVVSGAGNGRARAGAMQNVTITPDDASVTVELYPGMSGDIGLSVDNPNTGPFSLEVTSATGGAVTFAGGGDASACLVAVDQAAVDAWVATAPIIAGPSASTSFTIPDGVTMGEDADTSCQSASFDVALTLSAEAFVN